MENKHMMLQQSCKDLLYDLKDDLEWKWDERFDALLAQFNRINQGVIRSIIERYFDTQWNNKTIKTASENLREKVGEYGDLRAGQLLFTSNLEQENFVVVAWWPWAEGEKISLRLASPEREASVQTGLLGRIKSFLTN